MKRSAVIYAVIFAIYLNCASSRDKEEAYIAQVKAGAADHYSELAAEALDAGDYAKAVEYFRQAADLKPLDPKTQSNLGAALYKAGQLDSAIAHYQKALRLQPSYSRAFVNLGYALMDQQKFEAAHKAAKNAIQQRPTSADAYALQGKIYQAENNYAPSIENFRQAIALTPNSSIHFIDLGILYDQRGQIKNAIEQFEKAATLSPANADIFYLLGNASARLCRLNKAQGYYEKALRLDPRHLGALNNLGLILMNIGDYETAVDNFYQALDIDSTASPVLFNLSIALEQIDSPSTALTFISRAIQKDSSFAKFYLQRGNIYMHLGMTDLALRSFNKAIELEPSYAMVYNNLGNALVETSNVQQAELAYQRALALYPDFLENHYFSQQQDLSKGVGDLFGGCSHASSLATNYAMIFNNLGKSRLLLGKADEAEKDLQRAIRLQPLLVQPFENLAVIFQQRGERKKSLHMLAKARLNEARAFLASDSLAAALQTTQQAISFNPTSAECRAMLGQVYAAKGDSLGAETAFQQALHDNGNDATAHLAYGAFLRDQHKPASAQAHLQRAVELAPDNIDAHKIFADVLDSLGRQNEALTQHALVHYLLGKKREYIGQWDLAIDEYETASALSPETARFIARKGIVYTKKRLYMEAELFLSQALEIDANDIDALYGMGILLGETGNREKAVADLLRVIELQPNYTPAYYALAVNYFNMGQKEKASFYLQKAKDLGMIIRSNLFDPGQNN